MTSTSGLVGNLGQANYSAAKLGIAGLSKSIALDMAKYNVRSNCISPFAWSRMIGSIPTETEDQKARVEKLKFMETSKIAPLAVSGFGQAQGRHGQIFAVRANEIFLMSQSRPLRSVHRSDGWTPETIAAHAIPRCATLLPPRPLAGRVLVGPALKRVLLSDSIAPPGEEALRRESRSRAAPDSDVARCANGRATSTACYAQQAARRSVRSRAARARRGGARHRHRPRAGRGRHCARRDGGQPARRSTRTRSPSTARWRC
jgi:hypothetical protein